MFSRMLEVLLAGLISPRALRDRQRVFVVSGRLQYHEVELCDAEHSQHERFP
jgi:hypothetical protein